MILAMAHPIVKIRDLATFSSDVDTHEEDCQWMHGK